MSIYKSYIKVILKQFPVFILYLGIFMGITMINSRTGTEDSGDSSFSTTRMYVSVIDEDKSDLSIALYDYIAKDNDMVELENDERTLKNALFYRKADYIITIPEGFEKNLMSGKDVALDRMEVPGSYSGYYIDNIVDKYINLSKLYILSSKEMTSKSVSEKVAKDLDRQTKVTIESQEEKDDTGERFASAVNFASYPIMAIIMSVVGLVMLAFNEEKIKIRTNVSPILPGKIMRAQLICNGVLSFIVVCIEALFLTYINPEKMLSFQGLLVFANMLCLGFVVLAISYMMGRFINSRNGQSAATNVIALGCSFICGVFVPLKWLGDTVKNIARLLPVYYYTDANNTILTSVNAGMENMKPAITAMIVQIIYGLIIIIAVKLITKCNKLHK